MPVFKYKNFEQAEQALWNFNPDQNYYQRISEFWKLAERLHPIKYPKGIFKFQSIQEANNHREVIEGTTLYS
ncbi:MAG: hypothetical protein ACMUJM_19485 [bacterium]